MTHSFFEITPDPLDQLDLKWSGSEGVSSIICDNANGEGDVMSGYVFGMYDKQGRFYDVTDLPEPYTFSGKDSSVVRLGLDNMSDLYAYVAQEVSQHETVSSDYDAWLERRAEERRQLAQSIYHSGLTDVKDFERETGQFVDPLNHDVFDDVSRFNRLDKTLNLLQQDEQKLRRVNDFRVDRDINLIRERIVDVKNELKQLDDTYGFTEKAKAFTINGDIVDTPARVSASELHKAVEMDIPNIPGVSRSDMNQLKSDFGDVTEDNFDKFLTEADLLSDPGLVL